MIVNTAILRLSFFVIKLFARLQYSELTQNCSLHCFGIYVLSVLSVLFVLYSLVFCNRFTSFRYSSLKNNSIERTLISRKFCPSSE